MDTVDAEVRCTVTDGVASVVLDRPRMRNAITPEHRNRLIELLGEAGRSPDVRAVVLTGSSGAFCSGVDLTRTGPPSDASGRAVGQSARTLREGLQRLIAAILDCDKPVIAAVNGVAAGAGVHLALACDLVLMADTARLIEIFVRRGIAPDGGGFYLLPRLVGVQKAKELMFFGDDVSAADAVAMGLVNRVVPEAELDAVAREWASRLATGPTAAISVTKRLVNKSLESDRRAAFEDESFAVELVGTSDDAREGVQAFLERRSPTFTGR